MSKGSQNRPEWGIDMRNILWMLRFVTGRNWLTEWASKATFYDTWYIYKCSTENLSSNTYIFASNVWRLMIYKYGIYKLLIRIYFYLNLSVVLQDEAMQSHARPWTDIHYHNYIIYFLYLAMGVSINFFKICHYV